MLAILAPRKLRQEDREFEASLSYETLFQRKKKEKKREKEKGKGMILSKTACPSPDFLFYNASGSFQLITSVSRA
jgi:hypothetical protein